MFDITGRIMTIATINNKSSYVVIKKKIKGKDTPIAIQVFGYWNDKMKELKLNVNEKIRGTAYLKSTLYKGKWYTDVYFREILKVEDNKKGKEQSLLFKENDDDDDWHGHIIDENTGEIIL